MPASSDQVSRFNHLLKPIRDLARNWDIDVAAELEDYTAEISAVSFSFEGGEGGLDFAQAALLIQGSAMIYSKKVEFLYSLVYQTLEAVCRGSRAGKKRAARVARWGRRTL